MLSEDRKTLQFNQYQKSDKTPSITYADPESLIKKVDGIKNNHFKNNEGFDGMENKHDLYRGKYCMKKFCESLRELEQDLILQFMN